MPPIQLTEREQMLFVDQDHLLADFTFDSTTGWYRSPTPHRLLLALAGDIRLADLRWGMRLAVRLGWQVVQGKRWHWRLLERIGAGNRSEGVRRLVDERRGTVEEEPG